MDTQIRVIALGFCAAGLGIAGWYLWSQQKDAHRARDLNYKMNLFMYDKMITQDMAMRTGDG